MKMLAGFLREVPTGIAQIMLQPSPWVGVAFLVGAYLNSPALTVFALVGCISGIALAWALGFPKEERSEGLYGYNGGLVGFCIGYFYDLYLPFLILVVIGGILSSAIVYGMLRQGFRPLTFPFVIATWIIMAIISLAGWSAQSAWSQPDPTALSLLEGIARGYGQVMFQEHALTGLIFVAAIAIRSWIQGVYAMLASVIGLACGVVLGFPVDAINLGLFGYNGVLCGILFAGRTGKDAINAVGAILIAVAIVRIFHLVGLPALTFPFVLSSWFVLWARSINRAHKQ